MGKVVIPYKPRDAFLPFHETQARFTSIVAHRRAGKTVAAINNQLRKAVNFTKYPDGRFGYVAPFRQQAKDVAWTYLKRFVAPIPGTEISESELHVLLPNGARIRLYGSDNYEAMRGLYFDDVIMDEIADHHPRAYPEVIRPALSDRMGSATFIGTAKGKNAFFEIHTRAEADPEWFTMRLRASETGIIPADELAALRRELTVNQYQREMECSFDAAIEGAYFAPLLIDAEKQGRIGQVSVDPLMQTRCYWDIGGTGAKADATAIWVVQFVGTSIRVLDYYEAQGQAMSEHTHWLRERGYQKALQVLPHDGGQHEKIERRTYESALRDAGFSVRVMDNVGAGAAMIRVNAVRRLLPSMWFNETTTRGGRDALAAYHEKRDEERNIGLGPNHDWSSHGADAFGQMALDYKPPSTEWLEPLKYKSTGIR